MKEMSYHQNFLLVNFFYIETYQKHTKVSLVLKLLMLRSQLTFINKLFNVKTIQYLKFIPFFHQVSQLIDVHTFFLQI